MFACYFVRGTVVFSVIVGAMSVSFCLHFSRRHFNNMGVSDKTSVNLLSICHKKNANVSSFLPLEPSKTEWSNKTNVFPIKTLWAETTSAKKTSHLTTFVPFMAFNAHINYQPQNKFTPHFQKLKRQIWADVHQPHGIIFACCTKAL